MSSSNNDYNSGNNNNIVHPLSLYLSTLSGHQDIIPYPYNNQLTPSPSQMVSAVPDSLVNYMARFNSIHTVNQQGLEFPEVSREVKKVVKKDRHSKIHTAQGLRDRRVRLSIGIARQFFDLQDMLGYDKASKTLDWLLKKSRKAIKEVEQAKRLNNDDEEFGNNGGIVEEEDEEDDDYDDNNKSFVYDCEEEEVKKAEKIKKSDLSKISSKGSRAKAKGKEKERTSETMDPFKSSIMFNEGEDITHSFYKEAIDQDLDNHQESILTKSKINLPTNMSQSYNQGSFIMTDQSSSSSYNTILSQILDCDYDQDPFVEQSFSSVTDPNFLRGFP